MLQAASWRRAVSACASFFRVWWVLAQARWLGARSSRVWNVMSLRLRSHFLIWVGCHVVGSLVFQSGGGEKVEFKMILRMALLGAIPMGR